MRLLIDLWTTVRLNLRVRRAERQIMRQERRFLALFD